MQYIRRMFPSYGVPNIAIYYFLSIFLNGWFILPNWVFYFAQHISLVEIGIVEGVAVLVGLLMEVPSGALSDLLGKKRTILFGSLVIIVSCILLLQATEFIHFLLGNVLMFIGFSFHSGATEAFAYDSLVEHKKENSYDVVAARSTSLAIGASIVSTFVGGYLYGVNPGFPFVAWILFLSISVIILLFAKEPLVDSITFSTRSYLLHLREGVQTLFSVRLQKYIVVIMGLAILVKLNQGMVRQATAGDFGFTGETFGYVLAIITVPAIWLSFSFDRLRAKWGETGLLRIIMIAFIGAFCIPFIFKNPIGGIGLFFLLNTIEKFAQPLTSVVINSRIDSKHRATTLSTLALFSQIPYTILVLGFAQLTEPKYIGAIYSGYFILSVLLFIAVLKIKTHSDASIAA